MSDLVVSRGLAVKAFDATNRTADFVASTDVVDAHEEVVDQSTWKLDDYLKNPVVLFGHQSYELPIGQCLSVGVRSGQLECTVQFATGEMNPFAEQVWKMVQGKFLRAVSVGFVPKSARWEMRDGQEVLVWSDCVLKEISVVPVPANPEALAKAKALATCSEDVLRARNASPSTPTIPPAAPGVQPEHASEEDAMSEKEMIAKLEELTAKNSSLAIEVGATAGQRDKAEAQVRDLEPKVKALETENATLKTENAAFEAQTKALLERAEKAEKAVAELEAKTIEQEVDALVGKKITPAEKPLFIDLRKQNKDLFDKMLEQRAPMRLDETITAKGSAEHGTPKVAGDTADLLAEVKKNAGL